MFSSAAAARFLVASVVLCAMGFAIGACGVYEDLPPLATATPIGPNLMANPGFEEGSQPWAVVEGSLQPFVVTDTRANSGSSSLRLDLAGGIAGGPAITGARAAVASQTFPEYLSGMYFADAWEPGGGDPYLEFTVTAVTSDIGGVTADRTVRFIVAGTDTAPAEGDQTHVVMISRDEPRSGEWTYFGYPVRGAFEDAFGTAPLTWARFDISFNVRYEAGGTDPAPSVQAYFDDIFLGEQAANTNRPSVVAGG